MAKISIDRALLILAACVFGISFLMKPDAPDPMPFVSFNDGALVCNNIFIQDNVSREILAAQLRQGAALVEESGCVNYTFPEDE